MQDAYDVVVAGGGVAGVLAAARLLDRGVTSVLLLEREPALGGRLRSIDAERGLRGYGLSTVSEGLFQFWDQTLKSDPDAQDLPCFIQDRQSRFGVFAAGKISETPIGNLLTAKGARLIGGAAAARDWTRVDEILADENEQKHKASFLQNWTGQKKAPSAIVAEYIANLVGIADLWTASVAALEGRARDFEKRRFVGDWRGALQQLLQRYQASSLTVQPECTVADAAWDEEKKHWQLVTTNGTITANSLVVAQAPWEALQWLPKEYWPTSILDIALKTKPVSVVVLSVKLDCPDDFNLPDVTIVLAEHVHMVFNPATRELAFQAILDYELSLQAPAVVKAVKRLKRACRKLVKAFPELTVEGEHLALLPVGWSQSPNSSDRRLIEKMNLDSLNQCHLVFCGDAYGKSYEGDENIVSSVRTAVECVAPV